MELNWMMNAQLLANDELWLAVPCSLISWQTCFNSSAVQFVHLSLTHCSPRIVCTVFTILLLLMLFNSLIFSRDTAKHSYHGWPFCTCAQCAAGERYTLLLMLILSRSFPRFLSPHSPSSLDVRVLYVSFSGSIFLSSASLPFFLLT